jgi:hypothetical protein
VEKLYNPISPAFSCTRPTPPNFADSCSVFNNVASLGISGYEINEGFPLVIAPDLVGLPLKGLGFDDGYGVRPHPSCYAPLAQFVKRSA